MATAPANNPNYHRFDSKNLPYSQPGVAGLNYGITVDTAPQFVNKIRDAMAKGITTGGNERNWQRLQDWSTSPQAEKVDPTQRAMYDQFIKTGKMPDGLNKQYVYNALDWTLRDSARHQQTKTTWWQDLMGNPLVSIGLAAVTGGQSLPATLAMQVGSRLVFDALKPDPPKGQSIGAIPGGGTIGGGGKSGGTSFAPSGGGTGAPLLGGGGGGAPQRGVTGMGFGGESRPTRRASGGTRAGGPMLLGG